MCDLPIQIMLKPNTYYMSAYSETMKIQMNVTAIIHETRKTIQNATAKYFENFEF